MGRVFIVSLGFHEDVVMRMFVSRSITEKDRVYLITGSKAQQVASAYDSLVALCRKMKLPDPELVEIPMDLFGGVSRIVEILKRADEEIVVDLSGGMRYLLVFALVALFLSGRSATIYVRPESGEDIEIKVPRQVLEIARNPPRGIHVEILRAVRDSEGISAKDLSRVLGKSAKTIANCLTELGRLGLISRRGRGGGVYLTELGRLVLALAG
ncbi:MAG: CRISPR-associated CARF protein Csa3 [Sulfolobales archaeon]|nr:CRISPR-associated CARF protein Csa3 [Sulfolobales archaeon]MCX8208479.1 CRISPR-associated CARF protein Csa3 [Sulfolobales archaeon]MDW8010997.1 CRISPR-associated CARF protein Csa3 [Sulfolobales archaeon]